MYADNRSAGTAAIARYVPEGAELAQRARTALAGARSGHLVLDALARQGAMTSAECTVLDADGEPVLVLRPDSPALAAAQCRQLVRLDLRVRCDLGVRVSFGGRLEPAEHGRLLEGQSAWLRRMAATAVRSGKVALTLAVSEVNVSCPYASSRGQLLPLSDYASSEPDLLAAHGPWVGQHVNQAYPRALRATAARSLGVNPEAVIAARLADVDGLGADLSVVDTEGGHSLRLPFLRPVTNIDELVSALQSHLHLRH